MKTNFEKIIQFMNENTGCDFTDISESTRLVEDLGMNSLELLSLANDAEDDFGITISDDDINNIATIGDLVKLLDRDL